MGAKALGNNGPAHQFRDSEGFQKLLLIRDEGIAGIGVDAVEEVGLFIVVGSEEDVVDHSLKDLRISDHGLGACWRNPYRVQLFRIFLYGVGVQNLPIVFACIQIFVLVLCQRDLLLVIP